MIKIRGLLKYRSGLNPTEDMASAFIRQVAQDAIFGTFGDFPSYWRGKWERKPSSLSGHNVEQQDDLSFTFELRLTEDFFRLQPAGLQHLIGVLAGDLFYLKTPGVAPETITVLEVVLPETMKREAETAFRNERAHSIDSIRSQFRLQDKQPLLAFSFKPRL